MSKNVDDDKINLIIGILLVLFLLLFGIWSTVFLVKGETAYDSDNRQNFSVSF